MHAHGSSGLQPQEVIEMGRQKSKYSGKCITKAAEKGFFIINPHLYTPSSYMELHSQEQPNFIDNRKLK